MMLALAAAWLIAAQSPAAEPPPDFWLKVTFGQCVNEAVDTARATFTRTLSPGESRTARVVLNAETRRRLYGMLVEANVWAYPQHFTPEDESRVEEIAPTDFTIEAHAQGRTTVVEWVDRGSMHPEAVRLRGFLRAVRDLFVAFPEVQVLPASRMICL